MVCGTGVSESGNFRFESFSSTRYFSEKHAVIATSPNEGVLWQAMKTWQQIRRPLMLGNGLLEGDYGNYVVPFPVTDARLVEMELCNIAAHGVGGQNGSVSTFFCFSRVSQPLGSMHAHLLELLVPHLHLALMRVTATSDKIPSAGVITVPSQQITLREREILKFIETGKTNWEIAQILNLSPFTVKNHVQNILRKLNVQNRSHAVVKAGKLDSINI
jgi:transcriptional regulator EpsA